jgi:hypothetical protein
MATSSGSAGKSISLKDLDPTSGRVLPDDILGRIFHYLDINALVQSIRVCKHWKVRFGSSQKIIFSFVSLPFPS